MVQVNIDRDVWREMRQYLSEFDDYTLGELLSDLWSYAMENASDFEEFLDLEETTPEDQEETEDSTED